MYNTCNQDENEDNTKTTFNIQLDLDNYFYHGYSALSFLIYFCDGKLQSPRCTWIRNMGCGSLSRTDWDKSKSCHQKNQKRTARRRRQFYRHSRNQTIAGIQTSQYYRVSGCIFYAGYGHLFGLRNSRDGSGKDFEQQTNIYILGRHQATLVLSFKGYFGLSRSLDTASRFKARQYVRTSK